MRSGMHGSPGAKPGHPEPRQALLAPTKVIVVKPEPCGGGQREFAATTPSHTHQVIKWSEEPHHLWCAAPSGHYGDLGCAVVRQQDRPAHLNEFLKGQSSIRDVYVVL